MKYQAILKTPFAMLAILCSDVALLGLEFLPLSIAPQAATNEIADKVCAQLRDYLRNPDTVFDVLLAPQGTLHQQKVWRALLDIPRGATRQYGELAKALGSASQAIGQACGANPIALIIPCHRVVSKTGLGGFMRHTDGDELNIKRWLLQHESAL
ncbi:MAG: methylated-DNA--[protein]-cysteine S-methyltransferase [Sideroxydans sp.]|nr:methylated-DNA--[protein]-cysteine S-methyltransferase [Sideroxydans sp.]